MGASFYFYDLETSGFNPRTSRVMQFGGQRTDMDLKPTGKPDYFYIKITPDVLPDPDAVLVTGITPQKTIAEGVSEAEFLEYFGKNINKPETIFVGYNNIRFDDEFMRFMLWRNFWDAYEWQWKNGNSRWDLLDLTRMTRALRPEGVKWPFDSEGKPSNRLGYLSEINKIDHSSAHDALSDVNASIAWAQLLRKSQPKLFEYNLKLRDKKRVAAFVERNEPFVYTSGRYSSEFEKTTIAIALSPHPNKPASLVYDLRIDPEPFISLGVPEIIKLWQSWGEEAEYFPVKVLSYNRCPAIAPLAVLDKAANERLKIDSKKINGHLKKLAGNKTFSQNLADAIASMQPKHQTAIVANELEVETQLYEGFVSDDDRAKARLVRQATREKLSSIKPNFADNRLKLLLPIYIAKNFPNSLNPEQKKWWQQYLSKKLGGTDGQGALERYFSRIGELESKAGSTRNTRHLLEELRSYGQSISSFSKLA